MTTATIYDSFKDRKETAMWQLSNFPLLAIKTHLGKRRKPSKVRFRVLR